MHLKGILFDLDGTLADTIPICLQTFRQVLEEFSGPSYTENEIAAFFGPSEEGILQRMLPDRWESAFARFLEIYKMLHEQCEKPFAGIETALQLLKHRGISLAVVTGKGPHSSAYTLNHLGLAPYFDMVEVGAPGGIIKATAIHKVLAAWNMEPVYAAYVGDAASDVDEANAASVLPLGACWSTTSTIQQSGVPAFPRVNDFIKWINEHIATN